MFLDSQGNRFNSGRMPHVVNGQKWKQRSCCVFFKWHRFLHHWKTQYHVSVVLFIRATLQPIWKKYLEPGTHLLKSGRQNNPLPMDRRTVLYDCGPMFLPIRVNLVPIDKDGKYTIISERSTDTLRIPWWSLWMDKDPAVNIAGYAAILHFVRTKHL